MSEKQACSYVKLKSETMKKIAALCKKREGIDQINRSNVVLVTTLVNEAYEAEIEHAK